MPFATINGIKLHYDLLGSKQGMPVVLNGAGRDPGCCMLAFAKTIKRKGLRFLIWDKRNSLGQSGVDFYHETCTRQSSEFEIQVDDLYKLMKCLDMFPAVFIGNSLGSTLGLHMAAVHPDAVLSLVCMNMPAGPLACEVFAGTFFDAYRRCAATRGMLALRETPFYAKALKNPEVAKAFDDPDLMSFFVDYMRRGNDFFRQGDVWPVIGMREAMVKQVEILTLIVHNFGDGECDGMHTRSASEKLHELMPNSHLVMEVDQGVTISAIKDFVGIFLKNSYVPDKK